LFDLAGNALENGLRQVGREDVIKKTMYNVEMVQDELEAAAARAAMDQSGTALHLSQPMRISGLYSQSELTLYHEQPMINIGT